MLPDDNLIEQYVLVGDERWEIRAQLTPGRCEAIPCPRAFWMVTWITLYTIAIEDEEVGLPHPPARPLQWRWDVRMLLHRRVRVGGWAVVQHIMAYVPTLPTLIHWAR